MNHSQGDSPDLTLVIDIGKSHAKLLWVDDHGVVVEKQSRNNRSVMSPPGYPALDIDGLTNWIRECLRSSAATPRCTRAITSTHGAAFVALGDEGLAWAPPDYEFDGFATASADLAQAYLRARDDFSVTLSPDLSAGLNAARQLYWLQHSHPVAWARTRCLLPYPQYWAWWLSGVACSEVSSLGCHTQLWSVPSGQFSALAQAQGWAALFAPLQPAWQVLGSVRAELAVELGLPRTCQVHVGVHDSNACLARYLPRQAAPDKASNLTLVSSGTWTVVMAPGASTTALQAERDMLGNVSVLGQPTPTARFMGGREFAVLLDGAPAGLGREQDLQQVLQTQTFALPAFASQGGPFLAQPGQVLRQGQPCDLHALPAAQRSALAALYCAQVTAWLVQRLRPQKTGGPAQGESRLVVEGPLATNPLYMGVLQTLLPEHTCLASTDELEGTARGAWLLSRWQTDDVATGAASFLQAVQPSPVTGLQNYHARWLAQVALFPA